MSDYEEVARPTRRRVNARVGFKAALFATADTGKALRSFNAVAGYYSVARAQGLRLHQKRDGNEWIVWAERVSGNGHGA